MSELDTTLASANLVLSKDARSSAIPVEDTRVRNADAAEFASLGRRSTTNHQITREDRLALYKEPGWHGLGEVISEGLTGRQAADRFLGWSVEQHPVYTEIPGAFGGEPTKRLLPLKANVRSDTRDLLGVVGPDYKLVQNAAVGDFADALFAESKAGGVGVRMETCGSLLGGRKVFLTMRADRDVRVGRTGEDVTVPLLCVANGHDGSTAMTAFWTMQRVVCNNSLTMALGSAEADVLSNKAFRIRHAGKVEDYLNTAKACLGIAIQGLESYQALMTTMSQKRLGREELNQFFRDAYAAMYGPVATNPKNEQEEIAKMRADRVVGEWLKLMGDDNQLIDGIAGTMYAAFNAVTQYEDWVRTPKGVKAKDRQNHLKLLGAASTAKRKALRVAAAAV